MNLLNSGVTGPNIFRPTHNIARSSQVSFLISEWRYIAIRFGISFMLPSEMIEIRKAKFEIKFNTCNSLMYYFGL